MVYIRKVRRTEKLPFKLWDTMKTGGGLNVNATPAAQLPL